MNKGELTAIDLASVREYQGYTKSELARKLGVSPSFISMWESGTIPSKKNQKRLIEVLGVADDFFEMVPAEREMRYQLAAGMDYLMQITRMSLEDVARKSGVPIERLELLYSAAGGEPTISEVLDIADALDATGISLLVGAPERPSEDELFHFTPQEAVAVLNFLEDLINARRRSIKEDNDEEGDILRG